jgi:hypothetical protein
MITPKEILAFEDWVRGIYYRQIRGAEAILPGLTGKGKRLRGLTLAPNLYLARDKRFYQIVDGTAVEMYPTEVLSQFDLKTLRELFANAINQPTGA